MSSGYYRPKSRKNGIQPLIPYDVFPQPISIPQPPNVSTRSVEAPRQPRTKITRNVIHENTEYAEKIDCHHVICIGGEECASKFNQKPGQQVEPMVAKLFNEQIIKRKAAERRAEKLDELLKLMYNDLVHVYNILNKHSYYEKEKELNEFKEYLSSQISRYPK